MDLNLVVEEALLVEVEVVEMVLHLTSWQSSPSVLLAHFEDPYFAWILMC